MRIYSTEYLDPLPADIIERLLANMPADLRYRTEKYRRWQDAYGFFFGKYLLRTALIDAGFPADFERIRYTRFRRPYLPDGPDFNISHSGCRAVCAFSSGGRVGIDLEEINDLPIHDYKTHFTAAEWDNIIKSPSPVPTFYQYWTAKESVLKADGRGLGLPLAGLDVTGIVVTIDNYAWNIREISAFPNYACHVAFDGTGCDMEIKEFLPVDLMDTNL
jgi:4'-phosphopantetheinyl transferase